MKGLQRAALHVRWTTTYMDIFAPIADALQQVEEFLNWAVQSPIENITAMATHLLSAGGKRLRPALTLFCAQLAGGINQRAITYASVVELMHTATLIHDDVIDQAELRRGRKTVHHIWGTEAAIMCGDHLYARAFSILADDGNLEVIRTMAQASSEVCAGEILELQLAFNPDVTEEQCIEVARMKTAELIAASCKVGVLAVNDDLALSNALASFGQELGIAFQIVDDVLDLEGTVEEIGKPVGSDLMEGKITLPIRYALDALPLKERQQWEERLRLQQIQPEEAAQLSWFARHHNILERARAVARQFANRSLEILHGLSLPPSPIVEEVRERLERIALFIVERTL